MKGLMIFYVKHSPEGGPSAEELMILIKKHNAELIEKLRSIDYEVMYVPTINESSRVEKVVF